MKKVLIFWLLVCTSLNVWAQDDEPISEGHRDRLKAMRAAVITQQANLTTEQSTKFWAIYNEFEAEREKIGKELKGLRQAARTQSDEDLEKNFKRMFELREQEIALERKYHDKFLTVISVRQLAQVYKAEREIRRKIMREIRERQRGQRRHKRE